MQREIIRLAYDQPVTVVLDFADGIQVEGRYGIEFQYTVNNNNAMLYLPPAGRAALLQSGAQPGDSVQIIKSKRGRETLFSAALVGDASEVPPSLHQPSKRYSNTHGVKFPNRCYANPALDAAAPAPSPNGHVTNGHAPAVPPPAQTPKMIAAEPQAHPLEQLMLRCFMAAARVQFAAYELLLKEHPGLDRPMWEDIRASGTSFFIEVNKRNREGQ